MNICTPKFIKIVCDWIHKTNLKLFINTFHKWNENDSVIYSAALSFYLLLSLPAIILFSISLGGLFFDDVTIQDTVIGYTHGIADENMITVLKSLVSNIPQTTSISLSVLFSLILLIWSASNVFRQLKTYIDKTWDIPYIKKGFTIFFKETILSFITLFLFGLLITSSIIIETLIASTSRILSSYIPSIYVLRYTTSIALFIILILFFIYIYKILPEINIKNKSVIIGSIVTSLFITIGKILIQIYLSYSNLSIYSILASFIGLLMWLFFTSLCITYGVAFTKTYDDSLI